MEKSTSFPLELKSTYFGEFEGYASVFDVVDQHSDIIKKGAFGLALNPKEVKLLWQHKPEEPIGWLESIQEDSRGLYVKGKLLLASSRGKEAYELLKGGAISGLSIGFDVIKQSFDHKAKRIIEEIKLWEVSLVTFPANNEARVLSVKNQQSAPFNRAIAALWQKPGNY